MANWTTQPIDKAGEEFIDRLNNSPYLARTTTQAVATKPAAIGGKEWAAWMRDNFPAWRYDATTYRWHGPLADLDKISAKFPYAAKSGGARDYLTQKGIES